MTPLPKRRLSTARSSKRSRALKKSRVFLTSCPNCGQMKKPHSVCRGCGQYDGQVIFPPKKKERKPENSQ